MYVVRKLVFPIKFPGKFIMLTCKSNAKYVIKRM